MTTPFSVKPTLVGERVVLRPFTPGDIDAMGPVLADPDVLRLTGSAHTTADTVGRSPTHDGATRHWYETRADQLDRLDLAVVDRATDRCVGEVVLNDWEPENESCGFRILVGPAGRDRGLGSEATALVLRHAFAHLGLYRVELGVYAFNPRARAVYERAGFVPEGVRRAALLFDGERVDEATMAVLRPEWLARSRGDGTPVG
ncbi:GNAT family protein [Cellulomonas sp. ATA003]|uniref:GNAT family N-acetyltransferase n=1 Tax=Cellulomonas sp. ATA003 TaxID=3073064 RepID=UPI002872FE26|nr:GNAT family protein [Cellulomonas sp. ATA003]WNB86827.1 GNAT family protein [Cellulomonas sp. ATA003]